MPEPGAEPGEGAEGLSGARQGGGCPTNVHSDRPLRMDEACSDHRQAQSGGVRALEAGQGGRGAELSPAELTTAMGSSDLKEADVSEQLTAVAVQPR